MRELIRFLLPATIVAAPLVITSRTSDASLWPQSIVLNAAVATIAILLFAGTVNGRFRPQFNTEQTRFTIIWLALVGVSGLTLLWAIAPTEALPPLANLVFVGVLALLTSICLTTKIISVSDLAIAAALGGTALAAIGLLQYSGIAFGDLPGKVVPYGTQANKNLLTSAVILSLPLTVFAFINRAARTRILAGIALLLELALITASRSRGAWVAIAAATLAVVVAAIWWQRRHHHKLIERAKRPVWGALLLLVFLGIIAGVGSHELHKRNVPSIPTKLLNLDTESITQRLFLWQATARMIADAPIPGQGLGQWKIVAPLYYGEELQRRTTDISFLRPHNDFLWIASESGVVGLILTLAMFGVGIWAALVAFNRSSNSPDRLAALAAIFGLIAFAVDSSFSFSRERPALLMYVSIYLGMAIGAAVPPVAGESYCRRYWLFALAAAALLALSTTAFSIARFSSDLHTKRAMTALTERDYEQTIRESRAAEHWYSRFDYGAVPLRGYAGFALFESARYAKAVTELEIAYQLNPYSYAVLSNLAGAHVYSRNFDEARRYYAEVLRLWPNSDKTLFSLAVLNYVTGEFDSAQSCLNRIEEPANISLFPQYQKLVADSLESTVKSGEK